MNPYTGVTFFGFLIKLFERFFFFLQGSIGFNELASDEVQLATLSLLGLSAAPIGAFLILRKCAMLANALSHTLLLGVILSFLWSKGLNPWTLTLASLFTGLGTTFFTEGIRKFGKLEEDASIALVFTSLFALGILLANLFAKNAHIGLESVMGNVDALHKSDLLWVGATCFLTNTYLFLNFRGLVVTTFDKDLSKLLGFSSFLFTLFLMGMTSLAAVSSFKAVGVIMFLAFLTGPPMTARLLTNRLLPMLFLSLLIAFLAALFGVALSRHLLSVYQLPLSTGGLTTCLIGAFFFLAAIYKIRKEV